MKRKIQLLGGIRSLSTRMLLMLFLIALFCIFLVGTVTFRAMYSVERNRLHIAMVNDLQQINDQMRREYLSLIHISQQMLPMGNVGAAVDEYLNAPDGYEKIASSKKVSENLNISTFALPSTELAGYFSEEPQTVLVSEKIQSYVSPTELEEILIKEKQSKILFSNMTSKDYFDPLHLRVISQKNEIFLHGVHKSGSRYSDYDVVSIIRDVSFSDEKKRYIYLESRTSVLSGISKYDAKASLPPYSLIQLDRNQQVRYSELEEFPQMRMFPEPESSDKKVRTGRNNGYVWCYAEDDLKFYNVLLLPVDYYDKETNSMLQELVLALFFAIAIILMVSLMFRSQFYRPLKLLGEEMESFGKGDLKLRKIEVGITEYDTLFESFGAMKGQITDLMQDIYKKEKEKRQLELDKLYFQINPHFMMNALNSAQWQAVMHKQSDLAKYLSKLNFLLAYTLGKVSENTTLRTELKVLDAYLTLQQSRQDFQVHLEINEGLYLDRSCARLILQPIAENAICHSINEFGNIWVTSKEDTNGWVEISIRDDGHGFDDSTLSFQEPPEEGGERQSKKGIGLRYVWLSLEAFYQGKATMAVNSTVGKGTEIVIRWPSCERKSPSTEVKPLKDVNNP